MRILVVEDEKKIANFIKRGLEDVEAGRVTPLVEFEKEFRKQRGLLRRSRRFGKGRRLRARNGRALIPRCAFRNFNRHFFQRIGENEIVEIDRIGRRTMRASMNARLAEINRFGPFRL